MNENKNMQSNKALITVRAGPGAFNCSDVLDWLTISEVNERKMIMGSKITQSQ